jgi:hypothetical protein
MEDQEALESGRSEGGMKVFDRVPMSSLVDTGSTIRKSSGESFQDRQSDCESSIGHQLKIVSPSKIECRKCGAEWIEVKL